MGSTFHRVQHVKMCKNTEFQVTNTNSFLFVKESRLEGWGKVPHSKNSFWGHFMSGVHFPSYSAYQIVYLYQISCLYHKMGLGSTLRKRK